MGSVRFNEIELDRVLDFMQGSFGRFELGRMFLEANDLTQGRVLSTLPTEAGIEAASSGFNFGGKITSDPAPVCGVMIHPDGTRTTIRWPLDGFLTFVTDWFCSHPDGLLTEYVGKVAEEEDQQLTDWVLAKPTARLGTFERTIFRFYTSEDYLTDADRILQAHIGAERGWCFLGTSSDPPPLGVVSELDRRALESLVSRTEAAIVFAYDGEGQLVWTRTQADRWREVHY